MQKVLLTCAIGCLAVGALGSDLSARDVPSGQRVALLIGNSQYEDCTLPGAERSLDQVEKTLSERGFHVRRFANLAESELKEAVDGFSQSVPTNGVALVYYTGLAAHVERFGKYDNYLRPTATAINSEGDYRSRGFSVTQLIETLRDDSGARRSLVFLDGCWESPIKPEAENVLGGLREFEVGADTLVLFAAASGQTVAMPTDDRVSALATSLSRHVGKLDNSLQQFCEAMSGELGDVWFDGADDQGIGAPAPFPTAENVREGKSPGEGFVNSIGMTFRWCPPGTFRMGSDDTGTSATRDRQAVETTLTRGWWMGEHEVTQREYYAVMRKNVGLDFTRHKNAPFWGVSESKQITEFCKKLTAIEKQAGTLPNGWEYACPTEAEWEYACRAGSTAAYCFGNSVAELGDYGNFADQALWSSNPDFHWAERSADDGVAEALAPVGSYRPNAWGLRDMHGNVAEIVADHLLPELPGGQDPLVRVEKGGTGQTRGGAWCSLPLYCECSFRNAAAPGAKHPFVGFRVALKKVK